MGSTYTLANTVNGFLEGNKLISGHQFGSRSKRSTGLAATLFLDNIRKAVDNNQMVGAVFIDLSKAFDTIGHAILLSNYLCMVYKHMK